MGQPKVISIKGNPNEEPFTPNSHVKRALTTFTQRPFVVVAKEHTRESRNEKAVPSLSLSLPHTRSTRVSLSRYNNVEHGRDSRAETPSKVLETTRFKRLLSRRRTRASWNKRASHSLKFDLADRGYSRSLSLSLPLVLPVFQAPLFLFVSAEEARVGFNRYR